MAVRLEYLRAPQNDAAHAEYVRHYARQLHRDGADALAFLNTRTQPMTPNLTTYTTPELERLTTLTFDTMRPGEYVAPRPMVAQLCDVIPPSIRQSVGFKLSSGEIAGFDGLSLIHI